MINIVCFGVRPTEVEYFHKINEKFKFNLTLVQSGLTHENVTEAIGAEAIMVRGNCKADKRNLELLKKEGLKYVLTRTVGFDHVDLETAEELGLIVARVPGYSPNAISELAVTLSMSLLRHTGYAVDRTKNRNFLVDSTMFSKEIRNCTVGVLGVGKIGLTTAKLFKGLGANVIGFDVYQSDEAKEVITFKSLDEVVAESDVISVHMPYIKGKTYHLIDEHLIKKMKDGVILVNTARGEIQNLPAIIEAVESGKIGGFATDVLEGEGSIFFKNFENPEDLSDPIVSKAIELYPKVLITPHIGSYTDEALTNMIEYSLENMVEILETGTCKNKLTR